MYTCIIGKSSIYFTLLSIMANPLKSGDVSLKLFAREYSNETPTDFTCLNHINRGKATGLMVFLNRRPGYRNKKEKPMIAELPT